jgi:hypothetical protein
MIPALNIGFDCTADSFSAEVVRCISLLLAATLKGFRWRVSWRDVLGCVVAFSGLQNMFINMLYARLMSPHGLQQHALVPAPLKVHSQCLLLKPPCSPLQRFFLPLARISRALRSP